MQRTLQPELLDSLSPEHPAALHSRRDLRLTNRLLGTHAWFARHLPPLIQPGERALELGAGTGELLLALRDRGQLADGLDLWPRPTSLPPALRWHRADLLTFDSFHDYRVIFGNLIFHQFSPNDLARLGQQLSDSARVIVASEPARRRVSQWLFAIFGRILRANYVTLHDARISIAAGFRDDELPRALDLDPTRWSWRCTTSWLGAYRMIAIRHA